MFKESSCYETLTIPSHKPELYHLLDLMIIPELLDYKLITTPLGRSYEGQSLTGYKLIVSLCLKEKLTYASSNHDQNIHTVHYSFFKNLSMDIASHYDGIDITSLYHNGNLYIRPTAHSTYTKVLDAYTVQKCTTLRIDLSLCGTHY